MLLLLLYVLSWIGGIAAYLACLFLLWGQTPSGGDLRAVMFWSAAASVAPVALVYAPLMFTLRRCFGKRAGTVTYAATGVMLGVIPVLTIMKVFGGNFRSPGTLLFFCVFAAFGLVFGAGFSWAYGKRPSAEPLVRHIW